MPTVIPATFSGSPFVPGVTPPQPFALVILGATGDLAARKLLPSLFGLWRSGLLPGPFVIVGVARRDKGDDEFRRDVRKAIEQFRQASVAGLSEAGDRGFLEHVFYQPADFTTDEGMADLARRLVELESEHGLPGNRLFYLATDPEFFEEIVEGLAKARLTEQESVSAWRRVVIEKPFGHDLASAVALDRHVLKFLQPDQVYRIDHYLGKETVQNLLAFRFGNAVFEPIFNRRYVDHVQITVAETVGMEGRRGAYYDRAGALRDVVQNHVLQLLALIAMDPPATLKAADVGDAKLRVLRDLLPLEDDAVHRNVVRAQYVAGAVEGKSVPAYREEEAVAPDSMTETYVALRVELESWRWAGVPFLLRTGKRLARRATEIAVQFKLPPLKLFRTVECEGDFCDLTESRPNLLAFRIQPDEGIRLAFSAKRPGMNFVVHPVDFEFDYDRYSEQALPDAYERLLLDALRGDATLFMRSDELEAAWAFVTPILEAWRKNRPSHLPTYAVGSWGPAETEQLAADLNEGWRQP